MAKKVNIRRPPEIDDDLLTDTFAKQVSSGAVHDAIIENQPLPSLHSPRGQPTRIDRCLWRGVTLPDPRAQLLHMHDARIEASDLANADFTRSSFERVEFISTRLTGVNCTEAHFKSVLFRECKLNLAVLRMARLEQCVFERCSLEDADLYEADLSDAILLGCNLTRADISRTRLRGTDLRDSRLDGLRGQPANTEGLIIGPDQAPLLITLFGVRVVW